MTPASTGPSTTVKGWRRYLRFHRLPREYLPEPQGDLPQILALPLRWPSPTLPRPPRRTRLQECQRLILISIPSSVLLHLPGSTSQHLHQHLLRRRHPHLIPIPIPPLLVAPGFSTKSELANGGLKRLLVITPKVRLPSARSNRLLKPTKLADRQGPVLVPKC